MRSAAVKGIVMIIKGILTHSMEMMYKIIDHKEDSRKSPMKRVH